MAHTLAEPEPLAISLNDVAGDLVAALPHGVAEAFRGLLAEPGQPALDRAVERVRAHYGAEGCALIEWRGRGEWAILAMAGPRPAPAVKFAMANMLSAAAGGDGPPMQVRLLDVYGRELCGVLARANCDPLVVIVTLAHARAHDVKTATVQALMQIVDALRGIFLGPPQPVAPENVEVAGYHVFGRSEAMQSLYRTLRVAAASDVPALVTGETGVGKEHIVRMLHDWSRRASGPLVAVNCAAIPHELMESELFGIGKAVASGVAERAGKFAEAAGGTILFDEIGEMPVPMQAKLLRAIQEREVAPVGQRAVRTNVRVVAATNADLSERVQAGLFRADLYYRLAGTILHVPPLRERADDIRDLVVHFMRVAARESGKTIRGVTGPALQHLTEAPWPGNVRELEHAVRWLVLNTPDGETITTHSLPTAMRENRPAPQPVPRYGLYENLERLEREVIERALASSRGNVSRAAILLGISRNGLTLRLRRLGIHADAHTE